MSSINDDRYVLYEIHANLDLPGYEDMEDDEPTGIAIPYVVTVLEGTNEVLSIRRNYYEDDDTKKRRDHFVHYVYIPGFGFYGFRPLSPNWWVCKISDLHHEAACGCRHAVKPAGGPEI
jgi:hypothetical protein